MFILDTNIVLHKPKYLCQGIYLKGEFLVVRRPIGSVAQWLSVCTVSERPWV